MNAGEAKKIAAVLSIGAVAQPNAVSAQLDVMCLLFPNFDWRQDGGRVVAIGENDAPLDMTGKFGAPGNMEDL